MTTPKTSFDRLSHTTLALAALCVTLALPGCSDSSFGASAFDASGWSEPDTNGGQDTLGGTDLGTGPDQGIGGSDIAVGTDGPAPPPPPPPPEDERDFDLRTPEAGDTRLYIPSAGLDAVVVVDAADGLAVSLVDAGSRPSLLRALPGDAGAIVLNEDSGDVSILRPTSDGFSVQNLDVVPHHNRLELSPDGAWAFAWHDERLPGVPGSLNDVSAIRVGPGGPAVVYNLAVGIRPTDVFFAQGGQLAIFEAENGLSGVNLDSLAQDSFLPPVPLHDDAFIEANDREVLVTPDGKYAVVRELDRKELTLVDLFANTRKVLTLPDWPSDLDMTPDGARVVVPFVNTQSVAVLQVPGAWEVGAAGAVGLEDNPLVTVSGTGFPFGSALLSGTGTRGLLYTTVSGTLAVGLLDLQTGQVLVQPLAKEIARAAVDAQGNRAVLINRRLSGKKAPESTSHGYTVIDLDLGFEYLELTRAEPTDIVFTDDGDIYALVPDHMTQRHEVHRVRDFAVSVYETPHAPVFVGLLKGVDQAAVMLDDPTGWLTFIGLTDGAIDQVNSFELNSFIE